VSVIEVLRVVHYGLGPIGLGVARVLLERPRVRVVGAVDASPDLQGRDLGELLDREPVGVTVVGTLEAVPRAEVVVHATQSRLVQVESQILELVSRGAHVVSTCEELSYPWFHHKAAAERIHEAAQAAGVAVTALGVNPGFVMDLLPVILSAPCRTVRRVSVERRVDVRARRLPLQRKVGVGMTEEEFQAGVQAGVVGHVGLGESVAMIAAGLGWTLEAIVDQVRPVVRDGRVEGLRQSASGIVDGQERVRLDLTMALDLEDPTDRVRIEGDPSFVSEIPGGLHGDVATCALVANALPLVRAAPPGLRTVLELPPLRFSG
jgi:hypothetical protein